VPKVTTIYSNSLTYSSGTYVRPNGTTGSSYYYQAIQVVTYTRGQYNFRSNSSIDTYGCFYNGYFDPTSPRINLVVCDDDSGGKRQFSINATLYYNQLYYVVVTTYSPNTIGDYDVLATGPAVVYMTSVTPSTTSSSQIVSSYGNVLNSNSGTFVRPNANRNDDDYYYQAIQLRISAGAYYSFISISSMDTYGCLYSSSFDPSNPRHNLMICNDDDAGSSQFLINQYLNSYTTYILVVTTYSTRTLGSFTVQATGPASVGMTSISPPRKCSHKMSIFQYIFF